ncbi:MAG: phospholipase C [Phenylobacterium sp.]|jgi:phospholipase C
MGKIMEKQQSNPQGLDTFEHVVVLMLENRSFDNLLGYLYEDGVPQGKSFAGLQNSSCANPVPERANGYKKGLEIEPHEAADYHQPFPDPGEGYQHVNTQLYNFINPDNVGVDAAAMKPPYNIPENAPVPPMNGFVNDYVNTLAGMKDANYKDPDYSQYSVIMQCFKPAQVPVLTTLAREFAVFDHWHCAVPSQTWCNRAFWHAATSGGKVTNPLGEGGGALGTIGDVVSWAKDVWSQDNIFQRMKDKGVSYSIYAADFVSLTLMVNGTKVIGGLTSDDIKPGGLAAYKNAISEGTLAQYSFIEPWYMGQHNDQHPSAVSGAFDGPTRVGSVLLGEKLIWDVYTSLKNSDKYRDNTLLIITMMNMAVVLITLYHQRRCHLWLVWWGRMALPLTALVSGCRW